MHNCGRSMLFSNDVFGSTDKTLFSYEIICIPIATETRICVVRVANGSPGAEAIALTRLGSSSFTDRTIGGLRTVSVVIKDDEDSPLKKPWFMWFCILIGGISILFFTAKLVKDMKNNV